MATILENLVLTCDTRGCSKRAVTRIFRSGTDERGKHCRYHGRIEARRLAGALHEDFIDYTVKPTRIESARG